MDFSYYFQYFLSGLTNGSTYIIVAIGFNIIYNSTGIINFAQGEFLMLGAMTTVSYLKFMPLALAIICAVFTTMLIGFLIDLLFIRTLHKPTVLKMIIITIGLSIIIQELALHIWDEKVKTLPYFTGSLDTTIKIFNAYISPQVLWVLGSSIFIIIILNLFFKYSLIGKAMRACAVNKEVARLCGINTKNIISLSFIISSGIGAFAGCVITPLSQVQYNCGTPIAIKGFTVAILGGLGNNNGAIIAGIFLGIIESFSILFLPLAYKEAIATIILLIILICKPSGFLGKKELQSLKEF
ncbi:MAG TPA: branched-chain amino acid ABC transporter permease [bacterium]|nr:branched-chain amino acid ABC transporter permease [bacterium]HPQ18750.1 branched-chain amino acid ABC transporter permease [bacterium]